MEENDYASCISLRLGMQLSMIFSFFLSFRIVIECRKVYWNTLINSKSCVIFLACILIVYGICCGLKKLFVIIDYYRPHNLSLRKTCVRYLFVGYGLATLICSIGYYVHFDSDDLVRFDSA
uniref:7TM_GPCR_Srx domain-containing protein n=1 Tax=Caenorhabditis tropicalis TaxID=1561998 RepID=A0A1I7UBQ9_9PELO